MQIGVDMSDNNLDDSPISTAKLPVSFYSGLFTTILGLLVLVGWLLDIPALKSVLPCFVSMKANTAVGFVLVGLSLIILSYSNPSLLARRLSHIFAYAVMLIGLLTVLEYVLNMKLGIDQMLFRESLNAIGTLSPGRMAPFTAINFILVGCALILFNLRSAIPVAQIIALMIGLNGLLPLIGYLYGVTVFIGIGYYTQMAVHTAFIFTVVSVGMLALRPSEGLIQILSGDSRGGWLLRRLLPLMIMLPVFIGWLQLLGEHHGLFESSLGLAITVVCMMLIMTGFIWWSAKDLNQMEVDRQRTEVEKQALMVSVVQEKNRLSSLIDGIPDEIWFADKQRNFILANPSAMREFNLSGDGAVEVEKLAKSLEVLRPDGTKRPVEEAPPLLALDGKVIRNQEEIVRTPRTGELRYRQVSATPLMDPAGGIIGSVSVVRDITELKLQEAALKEREREYQELIENMSSAIVVHSADTKILISNPMAENLLGLTKDQMQGKTALDPSWCFISEDHTPFLPAEYPVNQAISSGKPLKRKMLGICRPDRVDPVWVLCDAYPIIDADGHILKVVVSFVDVTEHKLAEREREKLEAQLLQSQKMEAVGQLAGGVAHDFNNMLSVINGYSEMILREIDTSDPKYERIMEINKAGGRSADLTRQLLAFARKQTIDPKVLDINDTVEGMLNMLRRLIGENIGLVWEPAANVWKVKVDPVQINQILANLIVNARDAISGTGRIVIETGKADLDEVFCKEHPDFIPGKYVVLEVSDNGCGMDKKTIEHIFEPFFTTKKLGEGTGLGLATVFGIVKQNNGYVNVYSELGKGTTFKIYLPRHISEDGQAEEKLKNNEVAGGTEVILLVEDEESILKFSRALLENLGYTVLSAESPAQAVKLAGEYKGEIHLLMTDVVMPDMSGRDLRDMINSIRPGIKCLFMSGYTADIIANNGVLAKGVNFLEKPFTVEALSVKLRKALA